VIDVAPGPLTVAVHGFEAVAGGVFEKCRVVIVGGQASAAMGRAAAAQTAKIPRNRYCGISTSETAASARDGVAPSVTGSEPSIWILLCRSTLLG
jgi:hypothetical protein